jgi:hypothetical protein
MDAAVSGDRHGGARRSAGRLGTATSRTYTATKQKGHFEGNVAIKELRERMALAPDLAEPPMPDDHEAVFGMVGRSPVSTSWSHHRRATTRFALTAYENRRPGRSRVQCPRDVNAASSNDNSSRSGVAIGLGFHGVDREAAEPVISGVRQSVREFVRVLIDDDKILRGWAALNFWRRGQAVAAIPAKADPPGFPGGWSSTDRTKQGRRRARRRLEGRGRSICLVVNDATDKGAKVPWGLPMAGAK